MSNKSDELNILIITDNGLETVGGEQESTKIIINGLKDNYRLGVIQPGNINNKISNVKYYNMTEKTRIKHLIKNPFAFLSYINKIRTIIHKDKPKIIHTQAQVSFFIVSILKKLKLIPRKNTIIHTERGLYIRYSLFFKMIFRFLMTELNVLVTTTKYNMNFWKKALNNKNYKLDFKVIENTAGEIFEAYEKEKKKDNNKLIVSFAGRYSEQKNWPLAVEISEKLYKEIGNDLKVIMAVGCLDKKSEIQTNKMFNYLSSKLNSSFKNYINVNLEKMNEIYYETDVFILTSLPNSESFGRTVVEAMSRKVAVLSTDAGGPVEIVNKKENILDDVNEFVKRVLNFYNNKNLLDSEKESNFNSVRIKYSLNNNLNKHNDLYKGYIKRGAHNNAKQS